MKLYFSNEEYKKKALNTLKAEKSNHTIGDAFLLITKDLSKEDLSNFTKIEIENAWYFYLIVLYFCYEWWK